MIQTLPYSTLLQYVYNELPVERQREVEEALQHDPDLAASCADLLLAQRALDGVRREPRAAASEAILRYSRTFLSKS
jgi:anti-sigma factor RsiW